MNFFNLFSQLCGGLTGGTSTYSGGSSAGGLGSMFSSLCRLFGLGC